MATGPAAVDGVYCGQPISSLRPLQFPAMPAGSNLRKMAVIYGYDETGPYAIPLMTWHMQFLTRLLLLRRASLTQPALT